MLCQVTHCTRCVPTNNSFSSCDGSTGRCKKYRIAGNFTNFAVLGLFAKVFSAKFGGVVSFGTVKASNPQKFSLRKSYFSPIRESFLLRKFTAIRYSQVTGNIQCSVLKCAGPITAHFLCRHSLSPTQLTLGCHISGRTEPPAPAPQRASLQLLDSQHETPPLSVCAWRGEGGGEGRRGGMEGEHMHGWTIHRNHSFVKDVTAELAVSG